jgi:hypothetical protein
MTPEKVDAMFAALMRLSERPPEWTPEQRQALEGAVAILRQLADAFESARKAMATIDDCDDSGPPLNEAELRAARQLGVADD